MTPRSILVLQLCFLGVLVLFTFADQSVYAAPSGLIQILPASLNFTGSFGETRNATFIVYAHLQGGDAIFLRTSVTPLHSKSGDILAADVMLVSNPVITNAYLSKNSNPTELQVTVSIPTYTSLGTYDGQVFVYGNFSGALASANLHLLVTPSPWYYAGIAGVTLIGVALSFVYSPLNDASPQVGQDKPAKLGWKGVDWQKHFPVVVSAVILSSVGFAYILLYAPFTSLPSDIAEAFLIGFFIHRGLDGLVTRVVH